MTVLVVRHAKAGNRDKWEAPDDIRPLTPKGEAQAEALVALLAPFEVVRVLSSPYLRCTQTVAPLAAGRGLAVEPCDALAEGEGRAGLDLVRELVGGPVPRTQGDVVPRTQGDVVLCTHGDVMEEVLDGMGVDRTGITRKGATWVLGPAGVRDLPPPE